ncbi:hypothetical protein N7456_000670 [Penicillium angulare]|uniref:Actin cortical patch SUR7/pH-response regulator PalI n=1 Tax=Penicillium angulare TaxID=116970 RepID=A0A9W9GCK6_9EURO|nr:hypothetical protein N7456_000670 [Penicillium angulare]
MLLKPATPLTILLFITFALLLLTCISTPIVKGIPLATYKKVDYGVFGYCDGDKCTGIHVGYTSTGDGDDFDLPSNARKSLSAILIVHPIAAFLNLVCLCLAAAAHFHAPSHSPRFLLALLILLLPTLLVTLLAFLVDILLFVPHLKWAGWIVLAATIILVSCGVVTCAMRRTLVSRKARKRRIAENAEMSGENYYNRQTAAAAAIANEPEPAMETKEPVVAGSTSDEQTFATFRTNTRDSDDDRTPLNTHTPLSEVPAPPSRRGTPYRTQDEQGLPPSGPYGAGQMMRNPSDPRLRAQYSDGSIGRQGTPPRGRGGYPPRGAYGRGGPYNGAPRGRGGYMGPMAPRGRGGMPPSRVPPRGGYRYETGGSFDAYGRPMHAADDTYETQGAGTMGPMREPSPGPIGMAVSHDNVGQAIEMTPQSRQHFDHHESMMSSDSQPHALSVDGHNMPLESPTSLYSRAESYVPARAGWGADDARRTLSPRPPPSPVHATTTQGTAYYEDVDPRFDRRPSPQNNHKLPSSLTPGAAHF